MSKEYSPYCPICEACGDNECCKAVHCLQHPDGTYCKTYLQDLKHAYLMNDWWYEKVYDTLSPELRAKYEKEFDMSYDRCYREN
jgi:hypothetical protein